MSYLDQIISPYLAERLADSTKVNTLHSDERRKQPHESYPLRRDIVPRSNSATIDTKAKDSTKVNTLHNDEPIKQPHDNYPLRRDISLRQSFTSSNSATIESKAKDPTNSSETSIDSILNQTIRTIDEISLVSDDNSSSPSSSRKPTTQTPAKIVKPVKKAGIENQKPVNKANSSRLSLNASLRRSIDSKKPVVSRQSMVAKKDVEPFKRIDNNNNGMSVEQILKLINMSKYQQSFRKIDLDKFKDLKEIDLNAIGITRPSEIKIFKEAIKKAKMNMY